jgi:hypothetical protein
MSVRDQMSCEEFRDMVDGYALAVLDPGELLACAQHLNQPGPHERCLQTVNEIRDLTAELVDLLPPMAPRPIVWDGIIARMSADAERLRLERVQHQRPEATSHQGQA